MPDRHTPGVFIEESSFGGKAIEGVATSTAAFVGPTRKGPPSPGQGAWPPPPLLTSFGDFERIYGGSSDLVLGGVPVPNYVAHSVRAFFDEGGSKLYVARVVVPSRTEGDGGATTAEIAVPGEGGEVSFRARFPGAAANGRITVHEVLTSAAEPALDAAPEGTLARSGKPEAPVYHLKVGHGWAPMVEGRGRVGPRIAGSKELAGADAMIVTARVVAEDGDGAKMIWDDLGFDPRHPRGIRTVLAATPDRGADWLLSPYGLHVSPTLTASVLHERLLGGASTGSSPRRRVWEATGGSDGVAPAAPDYADALDELAKLEDVATVAAPGSSAYGDVDAARAVMNALISHCEAPRAYRMAVLDTPPGQSLAEVRTLRSKIDSRHAALYYPWVVVPNPNAQPGRPDIPGKITLPPSGFIVGIYARIDAQRGVHKAPANEVIRGALGFEVDIDQGQQEVLNPEGVNCLRLFPGRGHRVWGARLVSSDPEWKYVPQRRYLNYLEDSIDRGTQWAVFEPNGEPLWARIRQALGDFLVNEWRRGALLGPTVDEAFFVRCDRSTMTQNDLDNGRLVCLVGVAVLRPAEFVVFRIGQKTADAGA